MKRLATIFVFLLTLFLFPVVAGGNEDKVTVCHATGSKTNPYVVITIDRSGWENGHKKHDGDFLTTTGNCLAVDKDKYEKSEKDKKTAAPSATPKASPVAPAATSKPSTPTVKTLPSTSTK